MFRILASSFFLHLAQVMVEQSIIDNVYITVTGYLSKIDVIVQYGT